MKPAPFAYHAPASLDEALALLAEHGDAAKVLSGGQSLVPVMSFRLAQPAVLVDVNRLRGLDFVEETAAGGLRLGGLVRLARLEREPAVARRAPLLAAALPYVAHPQIRNRGTVGGSLAHADPAAELPAVAVAADARFRLASARGERWVEAASFFHGLFATALAPDELLVEVELPPWPAGTGWSFSEIARRHGDYAQVGLAASLSVGGDGRIGAARLVYLSVGDAPVDARRAAAALVGERPDEEAFRAAAELAAGEEIAPDGDVHASAEYKRHLARVLTVRALREAAARAGGGGEADRTPRPGPHVAGAPRDVSGGGSSGLEGAAPDARTSPSSAPDQIFFPASSPEERERRGDLGGGSSDSASPPASDPATPTTVSLSVNGRRHERAVEPRLLLSDFLRHDLGLTGTHVGCEHGVCGACTVLVDGEAVRSCLLFAVQAEGREVSTVEGLTDDDAPDRLHPLQEAFRAAHGLQCGFCTPGFLMSLVPFLRENPDPTEDEIRLALSGNLCRCTGYQNIVEAVRRAAAGGAVREGGHAEPGGASSTGSSE